MTTLVAQRSSKRIAPFKLHRPVTVEEAVAIWRQSGQKASFMAGGISLLDAMKSGWPAPVVIHLGRIRNIRGVRVEGGTISIGAATTLWEVESLAEIQRHIPRLSHVVGQIGNIRVRMKATVGGNIMAGDPNMEILPVMMALDAQLIFVTGHGQRVTVPADSLFQLGGSTEGKTGLLVEVVIPTGDKIRLGYDRTLRPAVTLTVGVEIEANRASTVRAAIACAYPRAQFDKFALSPPLEFGDLAAQAGSLAAAWAEGLPEPLSDATASATYRRRAASALMRRQLEAVSPDFGTRDEFVNSSVRPK